jgi:hypothetical protein
MHGKLNLVSACRYKAARWILLVQRHRFREVGAAMWVPVTTTSYRLFPSLVGHPRPSYLQAGLLTSTAPTGARSKCYTGKFASVRGNGGQLQRCLRTRMPWRWPCSSWCLVAAMRWHGPGPASSTPGRPGATGEWQFQGIGGGGDVVTADHCPSLTATDFMPSVETLL